MMIDATVIVGTKGEAESLSRQFPDMTFEHCYSVTKPVGGKDFTLLVTPQSADTWKLNAKDSWGQNLYILGAKTVRHCWPSSQPAILDEWHKVLNAQEFIKLLLTAPVIEFKRPRPIQAIRSYEGSGLRYLASEPEPPKWVLRGSLLMLCLAIICAPPGTGKGFLAMQLGACLAAGKRFFKIWEIERPLNVLYISGEESSRTVWVRARGALEGLSAEDREEAAGRFWAFSVSGCVHLVEPDGHGGLRPTESYWDLDRLIDEIGPDIVIMDTFARLIPTPENDNTSVTMACGLLEELIVKHGCGIIVLHHSNKAGGALVRSKDELYTALSQSALRGASALPACARWVLNMAPLSDDYAQKAIGEKAKERPSGTFVAIRVSKKNEGAGEPIHYLEHGEGGFFEQVEAAGPDSEQSDATRLAEEVERREAAGEPPLSEKSGGEEVFKWGWTRSKNAAERAVQMGLLMIEKKSVGKGNFLRTAGSKTPTPKSLQNGGVFDFKNENS